MAVGDINSQNVGSAARFNDGKIAYELIPTHLLADTARVLDYGRRKYAAWNWAKGQDFSVVLGSLKRHLAAFERGEDIDPESGLPHLGHIGCNFLFLTHFHDQYPQLDDRPKKWFMPEEKKDTQYGRDQKEGPAPDEEQVSPGNPMGRSSFIDDGKGAGASHST